MRRCLEDFLAFKASAPACSVHHQLIQLRHHYFDSTRLKNTLASRARVSTLVPQLRQRQSMHRCLEDSVALQAPAEPVCSVQHLILRLDHHRFDSARLQDQEAQAVALEAKVYSVNIKQKKQIEVAQGCTLVHRVAWPLLQLALSNGRMRHHTLPLMSDCFTSELHLDLVPIQKRRELRRDSSSNGF